MSRMPQSKDSKRESAKAAAKPVQQQRDATGPDASLEQVKAKDKRDNEMAEADQMAAKVTAYLQAKGLEQHVRAVWRHDRPHMQLCNSTVIEPDMSIQRIEELMRT